MRIIVVAIAPFALLGATAPASDPAEMSALPDREALQGAGPGETVCRDRIHTVRAERGLPALRRENASEDEPLLIKAVDRQIDGCSVMVMAWDTSDVRPLPRVEAGPPRLRPAR